MVRIGINEDCWLGINGVKPAFAGARYRRAISDYVQLLHRHGLAAEIDLMWSAPGTDLAVGQDSAPDEDHSPATWAGLAAAFKDDHDVILAPFSEPTVSAACLLHGGDCGAIYGPQQTRYDSAGMQQAVDVIRHAGYTGPIAIPGIVWANDMTQWLAYEPHDPLGQLIAEAHVYGKNACDTTVCFDKEMGPVAAKVPLIFGETGETYDGSDCGSSYIATFMSWADAHDVGYIAWAWNTFRGCMALISNDQGRPANGYGTWVHDHYASTG